MNERAIFIEALDRDTPAERAAYLAEACAGDPALRERVEALLRSHEAVGDFPGKLAPQRLADVFAARESDAPRTGSSTADGAEPLREAAGAVIGPYKLLEQVGEGGMGAVWMAEQKEPIQRRVAVKVIKAGMDSKQVLARFEAERQALALMDHPNIARVLDAGSTGAGRPYFVMELVKGTPITK